MSAHPEISEIEIAVIGGGIVGLCLSWFLAMEGRAVACLDDGRLGGSTANAGSLHVQMQSRFIRLYPELAPGVERALPMYVRGVRHWQEISRALGDTIGLKMTGGLMVAEDAQQYAFLTEKCQRERQLGLQVEMLGRAALDRIAPYLGPAVFGAEFCADEGKLDPLLANGAIRHALLGAGGMLCTAVTVNRLSREGAGFLVETSEGTIRADRVAVAAGARTRELAQGLGVTVPATAEPLCMNITEASEPIILHLVQHAERMITMKQLAAGQVVIGGGWPARLAGRAQHPTVELASMIGNLSLAQHVVPRVGALRLIRTWAGVNTIVDGRAVLGGIESVPGLTFAIPGDAGYTLGPLTARLAADTMLGREPEFAVAEFSPARFAATARAAHTGAPCGALPLVGPQHI
jgi:glycine/D-amino acid oxidase-like deaminating enzyme